MTAAFSDLLLAEIRSRFAHVETCPFQGQRIFFENAGGALTLHSVVETSARYAAIPDNQGRDNPASAGLQAVITRARTDMALFFGASSGQFFVGESGTELTFRLLRAMILSAPPGPVLGSTVEHPASRSAARKWAHVSGRDYISVHHDDATGLVTADAYAKCVTADTRVATILHTSPVTGMGIDVAAIVATIRDTSPDCLIFVDGIQHASHGGIDIDSYGIDGYVISPYKVFSRHGYGIAWLSHRATRLRLEGLVDGPAENWEFGTRDTGAYATFSDVVAYFEWLGERLTAPADPAPSAEYIAAATDFSAFTPAFAPVSGELAPATARVQEARPSAPESDPAARRVRITRAGQAIHAHEKALTDALLFGTGNLPGLAQFPGVHIVGGPENPAREGLVSFWHDGIPSEDVVAKLNDGGIRTHTRKADHYSANILDPLGQPSCIRVSLCHYNSIGEIAAFLAAIKEMTA